MKRTPLKRKTALRAKRPNFAKKAQKAPSIVRGVKKRSMGLVARKTQKGKLGEESKKTKKSKLPKKGYKPPTWFTAIKPGGHGNTPAQKRYWRLVSIAVRVEDFEKYRRCVSCKRAFDTWQEGQAGHYKAWANCNGFFKYERKNLALICTHCNHISDGPTNERFLTEMQHRHGHDFPEWVERENLKHKGEKMEVWEIVERATPLYEKYHIYL